MFLSSSAQHTFIVDEREELWAFGRNDFGQLGLGDCHHHDTPTRVVLPTFPGPLRQVAVGGHHSLLLDANGGVWATGLFSKGTPRTNEFVLLTNLPPIQYISAGRHHSMAVDGDGKVWGFSFSNELAQLGLGTTQEAPSSPQQVPGLPCIVSVTCGEDYTFALDTSGALWGFGDNGKGQLGLGDTFIRLRPVRVLLPSVRCCSAGEKFSVVVDNEGIVWTCGRNSDGQLGRVEGAKSKFSRVPLPTEIRSAVAGAFHVLALDVDNHVWVWGHGHCGVLALPNNPRSQITPIRSSLMPTASVIAAGRTHTMFLSQDKDLYLCGKNTFGQLGVPNSASHQENLMPHPTLRPHALPLYKPKSARSVAPLSHTK